MKRSIHNPLNFSWWNGVFTDIDDSGEPPAPPSPHPDYEPEPPVHTDALALA